MSSTPRTCTPAEMVALQEILQEIVTTTNHLESAFQDASHEGTSSAYRVLGKGSMGTVQKLGWATDKTMGILDRSRSGTAKGGAEYWFLGPYYNLRG